MNSGIPRALRVVVNVNVMHILHRQIRAWRSFIRHEFHIRFVLSFSFRQEKGGGN